MGEVAISCMFSVVLLVVLITCLLSWSVCYACVDTAFFPSTFEVACNSYYDMIPWWERSRRMLLWLSLLCIARRRHVVVMSSSCRSSLIDTTIIGDMIWYDYHVFLFAAGDVCKIGNQFFSFSSYSITVVMHSIQWFALAQWAETLRVSLIEWVPMIIVNNI